MNNKRIRKDFDLSTNHLTGQEHYVPPRARTDNEIERRRRLPRGVLVAEQQHHGLTVASTILRAVSATEDVDFSTRILAASGFNSAWYGFARQAEVMRRRLKLPLLGVVEPGERPSSRELLSHAAEGFDEAFLISGRVLDAMRHHSRNTEIQQKRLGRQVGGTALLLACVNLGDDRVASNAPDYEVQAMVRRASMATQMSSELLADEIGTPPSLAQLADLDSDLAVWWRRQAPNGALDAYKLAVEDLQAA